MSVTITQISSSSNSASVKMSNGPSSSSATNSSSASSSATNGLHTNHNNNHNHHHHNNNNNHQSSSGTPSVSITVKEERHDEAEIAELAAKMLEVHKLQNAKSAAAAQVAAANRQAAAAAAAFAAATSNGSNGTLSGNTTTLTGANGTTTITANGPGNQASIMNYLTRKAPLPSATSITSLPNSISAIPMPPNDKPKPPTNNPSTNPANPSSDDDKKACDEESQKGHFGWATFGKIHIPYILRQSEKYCAVRMVEMKLLNKYLNYLHQDIYSCTCVRSYYITEAESRLLNEINHKHCDSQFGREMFSQKDLVVRLTDANKFYQFLDICYKKLLMGNSGPSDKCGFIRINKESVVPYTVRDTEKFVPLFYFEGETDNLKLKADYLSGWDLSYLKFCCKVQGIRNELFASDSVAVISLIDIKSYFPTGTEFEDYWPSKVVDTQLLVGTKSANSSVHWTRQPSAPPPKITPVAAASVVPPMASSVVKANPQNTRKPNSSNNNNSGNSAQSNPISSNSAAAIYSSQQSAAAAAAAAAMQMQQQSANSRSMLAQQHQTMAAAAAAAAAISPGMNHTSISAAVQALTNAGFTGMAGQPGSLSGFTQAQTEQVLRMAAQAQVNTSIS